MRVRVGVRDRAQTLTLMASRMASIAAGALPDLKKKCGSVSWQPDLGLGLGIGLGLEIGLGLGLGLGIGSGLGLRLGLGLGLGLGLRLGPGLGLGLAMPGTRPRFGGRLGTSAFILSLPPAWSK